MSRLTPGLLRSRPDHPVAATAPREAWQRAAFVLLAAGLDMAAVVMLVSRHLPSALVGVLAAGLGWFTTGRITAWYPASSRSVIEESTRR
ncbi:hypothetical protein OG819_50230 [Streptomyces sp. NBC_01549]|uniref:hypothetical protein n=1 Tax=unclassified Streptomyces TaxID=2593676 RepID=UPI0022594A1B|nr:hypothetical protein [Streptomyces sp. NBC_01549]MCX4597468.1 hypothetical protein [Streptomyces sp. NBC_01549]